MQSSPQTPDRSPQCRICRAALPVGNAFCAVCGAQVNDMPTEELRGVIYLLSELPRWEALAIIGSEQAAALRQRYERRRDELRALLESDGRQATRSEPSSSDARQPESNARQTAEASAADAPVTEAEATARVRAAESDSSDYAVAAAFSQFLSAPPSFQSKDHKPRRTFIEALADPYTLRLLLYTGAAMLVVGIVIWLRDVLYLKLQEPIVQAALLALGTISVTASGWYTILRTRQRLTGRALTLIGSVLVPVNFWFLVRSGLIANTGRAWVVCAFCATLYAHTAALLRERLYVYLACVASVATCWALVFRTTPDAFGLYALSLMGASLVFLHLSRLFPLKRDSDKESDKEANESSRREEDSMSVDGMLAWSRFGYGLWGPPLVRTALVGATLSALLYMPLRLWPSSSLYDGIFRLRANVYDPSIAMLLFAAAAYVAWFMGRYIYAEHRVLLYTLSTLALFWTELLTLDGFLLSGSINLLALTATTLAITLAARLARHVEAARALHFAGLLLSLALMLAPFGIILTADRFVMTHSTALACLGLSFALLSTPRFCGRLAQSALAHASAIFGSLAFLIALGSASIRSETLFVAACAAWPFALYACAQLARRQGEAQLTAPLVRIADAEFILLFLWAGVLALLLHVDRTLLTLRTPMFCALLAAALYGSLRAARDHSAFGAGLVSLAALVIVAAMSDALKVAGLWPAWLPIAAGVICAAFLMRAGPAPGLLDRKREGLPVDARPLRGVVHFVMDMAVIVCAMLWFATAVYRINEGGGGAAFVLLLALLYWIERAAQSRLSSIAHLASIHAGGLFIALLIALRIDTQWFAAAAALILFPLFFATAHWARRRRDALWVAAPASMAAVVTMALAFIVALLHAAPHLRPGDPLLLAPLISSGSIALVSFCASLLSAPEARVRYFRAGLSATVVAFALGCLRAGYDPVSDIEIYTSPLAVLLLAIAFLSARRSWEEYDLDTSLLLWIGSLLLSMPLLFHALYFRLLLDVPATGRDLGTLCASLALILFGALGRFRAPVLVGVFALMLELAALALTSVNWLQIPLRNYLMTVGALIVLVVWAFEYRREQIMLVRKRFNERRDYARERFGEWR